MSISEWKDVNGEVHKIEDMTAEHIKNCIRLIEESAKPWVMQNIRSATGGFGPEWAKNVGQEYIDAFKAELQLRKGIKMRVENDDLPNYEVDERCGNCRFFHKCRRPQKRKNSKSCSEWRLNSTLIECIVSDEDYIIATRGGFYCNGIRYIASKRKHWNNSAGR